MSNNECFAESPKGRFEFRKSDYAIIDSEGEIAPIMIEMDTSDDGSESQYTDRASVLHLLNKLNDELKFASLLANHRGEIISFANALIDDLDDNETINMWSDFKEEMYQKWKKREF